MSTSPPPLFFLFFRSFFSFLTTFVVLCVRGVFCVMGVGCFSIYSTKKICGGKKGVSYLQTCVCCAVFESVFEKRRDEMRKKMDLHSFLIISAMCLYYFTFSLRPGLV